MRSGVGHRTTVFLFFCNYGVGCGVVEWVGGRQHKGFELLLLCIICKNICAQANAYVKINAFI